MTPEEHESMTSLETENAELRSEVARLRTIAAERDALADEVTTLRSRAALRACGESSPHKMDDFDRG